MPTEVGPLSNKLFPPRPVCSLPPDWSQLAGLRDLIICHEAEWAQERREVEGREWRGFTWGSGSLSGLTALTSLVLSTEAVLPGESCFALLQCLQVEGCHDDSGPVQCMHTFWLDGCLC